MDWGKREEERCIEMRKIERDEMRRDEMRSDEMKAGVSERGERRDESGSERFRGMGGEMEKKLFTRLRRIAIWEEEGCLAHCSVGEVTTLPPGT